MHQPLVDAAVWTPFTRSRPACGSHILVLAYPRSGAERLWSLLAGHPSLACSAGTELIPLCDQAASTWRTAEASGSTLSTLAAASVRAMAGGLITIMKSRAGRERWCEVSTATARAARTFLQLYPDTQVICLHRGCVGFMRAAMADAARRPGGAVFGAFAAAHPGNPLAGAAAYWCDRTEQLLALERDKPGLCRRVRCEDLAVSPAEADRVLGFLGLRQPVPGSGRAARADAAHANPPPTADLHTSASQAGASQAGTPHAELPPGGAPRGTSPHVDARARPDAGGAVTDESAAGGGTDSWPGDQAAISRRLPAPLLERVSRLHAELGYPAPFPGIGQ